jgi:membrane-bound metal-dependent hydrolase YbcI (DUF457 family)
VVLAALAESTQLRGLSAPEAIAEMAGAVAGACFGARSPDVFEPPTSPRHRGFAHSVVAGTAVLCVTAGLAPQVRNALRSAGVQLFALGAEHERDGREPEAIFCSVGGLAMYALAGFAMGVLLGYVSHLALDLTSGKAGLPVLCRACG